METKTQDKYQEEYERWMKSVEINGIDAVISELVTRLLFARAEYKKNLKATMDIKKLLEDI